MNNSNFNLNNLLKNKSFYLMNIMILISLLSIFMSNYIQLWIMMEINTMLFIIMMSIFNNKKKIILNYFIIQSFSSLALILLMIYNKNNNINYLNALILLLLIMKMNMFPFFFWMPLINMQLNWISIFFMSTTQKIIPLLLFNMYFHSLDNLLLMMITYTSSIFSSLTATILSINEINMKKILTLSSLNHSAWMLFIIMIDKYLFLLYFFLYSTSMIFICLLFNKLKINNFYELYNLSMMNMKWIIPSIIFNLLIISALPPFLTFFIKIKMLTTMIINANNFTSLMLLILSISTLIFYMNLLIKMKLSFSLKNKFWISNYPQIKNSFYSLTMFIFLFLAILFLMFKFM